MGRFVPRNVGTEENVGETARYGNLHIFWSVNEPLS